MKVLVVNAGSASQKCSLFEWSGGEPEPLEPLWNAELDTTAPGQPEGRFLIRIRTPEMECVRAIPNRTSWDERLREILRTLWEGEPAVLKEPAGIDGVGHRVVHGGAEFASAVLVNDSVEAAIERLAEFAPLHNAHNLAGIRAARALLGADRPHFAIFDTAFHRTLPPAAATYAGPRAWLDQGIRRYGFHGTSFRWASRRAARLLEREGDAGLRLVLAHLGGGCSLCATVGGQSIDTTMGFTPLDGIAMCSRSGAVDPGILLYLLRQGTGVEELERMLNQESGLKGLSGLAGDTRILLPEARKGNEDARLAIDVFVHRLRAGIGQMIASLGARPDAFVFTDAIGEDAPQIRSAACEPFRHFELALDEERNAASVLDEDISAPSSSIRVLVVKARENWQIALECAALLGDQAAV